MKIEHVALQVPDPVAMADWYVQHLGCSIARSGPEPASVRFVRDDSGRSMIEIYRDPRAPIPDYTSQDPLLVHVAFVSADLPADRDRLVAAGASIAIDIATTPAGDELLMLRDPWGIPLQLVRRASPMLGG
jgi:catechol 2,3-dioxygenase-like lactoylglutathione lyase family enzyme